MLNKELWLGAVLKALECKNRPEASIHNNKKKLLLCPIKCFNFVLLNLID